MYREFKQKLSSEPHEQIWNILFYPSLFTYSLFAAPFLSLSAVLVFLLIVSLSIKTPTDFLSLLFSYSYQLLLCLWLSFVSRCSLSSCYHSSVLSACPAWPVAPHIEAEPALLFPIRLIKWEFIAMLPSQQWGCMDPSSSTQKHQHNWRNTLCNILWDGGAGRDTGWVKRNWNFLGNKSVYIMFK